VRVNRRLLILLALVGCASTPSVRRNKQLPRVMCPYDYQPVYRDMDTRVIWCGTCGRRFGDHEVNRYV
jgi:hypothetical protein